MPNSANPLINSDGLPSKLRLNVIGVVLNYILNDEFSPGFLPRESVDELMIKYFGLDLENALKQIDYTVESFFEQYFKSFVIFPNPPGFAKKATTKSDQSSNFWIERPKIEAIEAPESESKPIVEELKEDGSEKSLSPAPSSVSSINEKAIVEEFPDPPIEAASIVILQHSRIQHLSSPADTSGGSVSSDDLYSTPLVSPTIDAPQPDFSVNGNLTPTDERFILNEATKENKKPDVIPNFADIPEMQINFDSIVPPQENRETREKIEKKKKELEEIVRLSKQKEKEANVPVTTSGQSNITAKGVSEPKSQTSTKEVNKSNITTPSAALDDGPEYLRRQKAKTPPTVVSEVTPQTSNGSSKKEVTSSEEIKPSSSKSTAKEKVLSEVELDGDYLLNSVTNPLLKKEKTTVKPVTPTPTDLKDDGSDLLMSVSFTGKKSTSEKSSNFDGSKTSLKSKGKTSAIDEPAKIITPDETNFLLENATVTPTVSKPKSPVRSESSMSRTSSLHAGPINNVYYKINGRQITNYQSAYDVKRRIADNVRLPPASHLLNLWFFNLDYEGCNCFPELVLFFQYMYKFTLYGKFDLEAYQRLITLMEDYEVIFRSCSTFARDIELMLENKFIFIIHNTDTPADGPTIKINPEVLTFEMLPLAQGTPSTIMFLIMRRQEKSISIEELSEYYTCDESTLITQVLNEINNRPDLYILENPQRTSNLYDMSIRLNPKVCTKFIVFEYKLQDLRCAADLHLKNNNMIDSISQFEYSS